MARTLPYGAYRSYFDRPIYTDRLLDQTLSKFGKAVAMKRSLAQGRRKVKRRRVSKATVALRIARSLKAAEEVKQYPFAVTGTSTGPSVVLEKSVLAGLAQGTDRNERVGQRIRIKRIKLTVAVRIGPVTDVTGLTGFVRFVMWQLTGRAVADADSSLISASYFDLDSSDRIVQPDGVGGISVLANKASDGRYTESKTIKDIVFSLNQHTLAYDTTAGEMDIGQNQAMVLKNAVIYPPRKMITFTGTSPDEAIVLTMACSTTSNWFVQGMVFYTDA